MLHIRLRLLLAALHALHPTAAVSADIRRADRAVSVGSVGQGLLSVESGG